MKFSDEDKNMFTNDEGQIFMVELNHDEDMSLRKWCMELAQKGGQGSFTDIVGYAELIYEFIRGGSPQNK